MQEQKELVERARAGDSHAFSLLAQQYQEMALGYALAILHDFHLAQDVTQEALLVAHRSLATLQDPARFPAWLRGIVRFQCGRILRKHCPDLLPLEYASALAVEGSGPDQHLEIKEGFHRVLAAIRALPDSQREVAMLFYIKDYSQRDIAGFLELPLTTVNNRLHSARQALRKRLVMISEHVGRVIEVYGPVIDVQFEPAHTPLILSALALANGSHGPDVLLQVVQRSASGLVRCLIREASVAMVSGMPIVATDGPLLTAVDPQMLSTAIPLLSSASASQPSSFHRRAGARPVFLETGIKVLDLLCPYTRGGTAGLFGPYGTGNMVGSAEVLRNIGDTGSINLFAFVHSDTGARVWYDTPEEVPHSTGTSALICLPIDNPIDTTSPAMLIASGLLDARTYHSLHLARSGIWPAVDPLLSTSRIMDPTIIGQEHYAVARAARQLLRQARKLQEGAPDGRSRQLTVSDSILVARARKLQRFFTQPFKGDRSVHWSPGPVRPYRRDAPHLYGVTGRCLRSKT